MKTLLLSFLLIMAHALFMENDDTQELIQQTLNLPFIKKALDDEGHVVDYETVILQNNNIPDGLELEERGKKVRILSREAIKKEGIGRFREYTKLEIEGNKAMVRFVTHGGGLNGAMWFEKVDNSWLIKKIRIIQNYRTIVWKEGRKRQKLMKTKEVGKQP